jgi:hypothetical protein
MKTIAPRALAVIAIAACATASAGEISRRVDRPLNESGTTVTLFSESRPASECEGSPGHVATLTYFAPDGHVVSTSQACWGLNHAGDKVVLLTTTGGRNLFGMPRSQFYPAIVATRRQP